MHFPRPLALAIFVPVLLAAGLAHVRAQVGAPVSDADMPVVRSSYVGPCHGGEVWSGGRLAAAGSGSEYAGIASFSYCDADEYTLAFYCAPGSQTVTLNVEMLVTGARDGETAEATLLVDDAPFEMTGITFYSADLDGAQPLLAFERDRGLLDALKSGSSATLLIGPEVLDIHLKGSAKAIEAMLAACP
jgi:hypothetical protein